MFVEAALAGDLDRATGVALDFMSRTNSRASVMTDLFDTAQLHIGNRWHLGDATVDDEYRVFQAIASAMAALPVPTTRRGLAPRAPTALLATVLPEEHDLGLRLVAAALEDDGWNVDLAPQMQAAEISQRVRRRGIDLVAISSTFDSGGTGAQLGVAVQAVHMVRRPVLVGGSTFARAPRLAEAIAADAMAQDARLAVVLARRLARVLTGVGRQSAAG